jgi:thiamine pyrophosphate-dependent acetolactate synthase large subunit-like protein
VLLGGATATLLRGRGSLQDIDQMALMRPHVKWAARATRVRDLGALVEQAFARSQSGVPGPVFVECPVDLLYDPAVVREWYGSRTGAREGPAAAAVGWYVRRHLRRLFDGAGGDPALRPRCAAT